ncbi:hypothetical protein N781_09225 [Pontibacillus halophilus JSM 076056 = DSM 19796]|uniref:NERD domain-containing protein n=1 Tax=Pontibacillus halophilus JSM 076056 = DSM 19796 TaxID=1385510 RepID=A0A0A5I0Q1_9BACI|nr:nuclease-related domain-containing protein [Pontibacillus halophilus]KGX89422.1 hypothetical protein N781_09225 [Pontibacillus halophilus JSM 076056 = DSM 19796]
MAQLVKLFDYISRYETNPYNYPGQYIRLKQENYKTIKARWDARNIAYKYGYVSQEEESNPKEFPQTELELKQVFLNDLLPFQLKWASRTLTERSFMDKRYEKDPQLAYFLQRFPDTYLVLYEPIFKLKEAPMQGDHVIISPQGIQCISFLGDEEGVTFYPFDSRNWYKESGDVRTKILNPLLSLQRTYRVVKSILAAHNIEFPVEQVILSQDHIISFSTEPYNARYIGKAQYEAWFERMRALRSPLKHTQLKALEAILSHAQTTSFRRNEWDDESDLIE